MEVIIDFTSYIFQHHQGESGIIYFLSQKVMLRTRLIFARVAELMLLLEFPGCRDGAKRVFETSNGVMQAFTTPTSSSLRKNIYIFNGKEAQSRLFVQLQVRDYSAHSVLAF